MDAEDASTLRVTRVFHAGLFNVSREPNWLTEGAKGPTTWGLDARPNCHQGRDAAGWLS